MVAKKADKPTTETPQVETKKSVDLDKKLANQGTFAVGVQAMMRNRINKRG